MEGCGLDICGGGAKSKGLIKNYSRGMGEVEKGSEGEIQYDDAEDRKGWNGWKASSK